MTMVIWAACDNFALMMADRRSYTGKVIPTDDGKASRVGEEVVGPDTTKALVSPDERDIYGIAGNSPAFDMVRKVQGAHGGRADVLLHAAVLPKEFESPALLRDPLESALDPKVLPDPNMVLHSYAHAGKIICCRHQWSGSMISRDFFVAQAAPITVMVAGSGGAYLQSIGGQADQAKWVEMTKQVADWRAVRIYFLRLFSAITLLDRGVGPDVDVWMLTKGEGRWSKLDE